MKTDNTKEEERIKYNKCKNCGREYGLHPEDENCKYFIGLPYENYQPNPLP